MQGLVEASGGDVLKLEAAGEDLNERFGNPLPGQSKELRVRYLVVVGPDTPRKE